MEEFRPNDRLCLGLDLRLPPSHFSAYLEFVAKNLTSSRH